MLELLWNLFSDAGKSRVILQTRFCAAGSVSIRDSCERFVNNMRAGTNCACPRGSVLLFCQIPVQHGCELGAGGEAGRVELAVCALQEACAAGPAHSGQRVIGHGLRVTVP